MRNRLLQFASAGAVAFTLFAGNAAAQSATGVNVDGVGQDLAWMFIEGTYTGLPSSTSLSNAWLVSPGSYPGCAWVGTCPASNDGLWISINPQADEPAGSSYTFFHVFNVAQGGMLTGQWSSDNSSLIYLNGTLLGTAGDVAYQNWHDFSGTLVQGQNVLAIQTTNSECGGCNPNPGGVIVGNLQSTVTPEPISMALLGTGLAGVAAVRRRRRKSDDA